MSTQPHHRDVDPVALRGAINKILEDAGYDANEKRFDRAAELIAELVGAAWGRGYAQGAAEEPQEP